MKLELQNKGDGPRIAQCYPDADTAVDGYSATLLAYSKNGFVICEPENFVLELVTSSEDSITIDTEANQPNIYRCIEQGFKIQVVYVRNVTGDRIENWDFSRRKDIENSGKLLLREIKSIRILDLEGREGVICHE